MDFPQSSILNPQSSFLVPSLGGCYGMSGWVWGMLYCALNFVSDARYAGRETGGSALH